MFCVKLFGLADAHADLLVLLQQASNPDTCTRMAKHAVITKSQINHWVAVMMPEMQGKMYVQKTPSTHYYQVLVSAPSRIEDFYRGLKGAHPLECYATARDDLADFTEQQLDDVSLFPLEYASKHFFDGRHVDPRMLIHPLLHNVGQKVKVLDHFAGRSNQFAINPLHMVNSAYWLQIDNPQIAAGHEKESESSVIQRRVKTQPGFMGYAGNDGEAPIKTSYNQIPNLRGQLLGGWYGVFHEPKFSQILRARAGQQIFAESQQDSPQSASPLGSARRPAYPLDSFGSSPQSMN